MSKSTNARATTTGAPWPLVAFAVIGLVTIITLSFWTSFTAQADVARRAGVTSGQEWVWPVILDGLIMVATVTGLVVRDDAGARRYAWTLVWVAAALSLAGNILHTVTTALDMAGAIATPVRVVVACIPPAALLAVTHLTLTLTKQRTTPAHHTPVTDTPAQTDGAPEPSEPAMSSAPITPTDVDSAGEVEPAGQSDAPGHSDPQVIGAPPAPVTVVPVIHAAEFDAWITTWRESMGLDMYGRDERWPTRRAIVERFGGSLSSAGRAIERQKERDVAKRAEMSQAREMVLL